MVTFVGTQNTILEAVQSLMELDYDAMEAYEAAINRVDREDYKKKLKEFHADHKRHVDELSDYLRKQGLKPDVGPSVKQWLTKGKVFLANMIGDMTILRAMLSNEEDTNKAYDAMLQREDAKEDLKIILRKGLEDEEKHKKWIEKTLG